MLSAFGGAGKSGYTPQPMPSTAPLRFERDLRRALVEVCQRMYQRGLIVALDGNVSARLPGDRVLTTPRGVCKGDLDPDMLVVVGLDGRKISGKGEPTTELPLHLECYRRRPDIAAMVHGHPPLATAFTVAGDRLAGCIIPEVVLTLGEAIPVAAYGTPSTDELPKSISELILHHDAILLDRHGSVTVGHTPWEAFFKLEKLEYAAQVTLVSRQLSGRVRTLDAGELGRLYETHGVTEASPRFPSAGGAGGHPGTYATPAEVRGCTDCGLCEKGRYRPIMGGVADTV